MMKEIKPPKTLILKEEFIKAVKLYHQGYTITEIYEILHVTPITLMRWFRKAGLDTSRKRAKHVLYIRGRLRYQKAKPREVYAKILEYLEHVKPLISIKEISRMAGVKRMDSLLRALFEIARQERRVFKVTRSATAIARWSFDYERRRIIRSIVKPFKKDRFLWVDDNKLGEYLGEYIFKKLVEMRRPELAREQHFLSTMARVFIKMFNKNVWERARRKLYEEYEKTLDQ